MRYKLIARDRIFCEGTLSECQKCLTDISIMADIVDTDYKIEEFMIVNDGKETELV